MTYYCFSGALYLSVFERPTGIKELQIRAQVKGIQKSDKPGITGLLVFRSIELGYKM